MSTDGMAEARHTHGAIVVISGPSGSGKTTLVRRLLSEETELAWSVSATTRPPRPGEVDGRDYWFLSREEFERRIEADEFAEYAESFGHLYGTPAGPLVDALEAGRVAVLDIDLAGARQIREKFSDAVLVWIKPPDMNTLRERLKKRKTETTEQFETRLERAWKEIESVREYDVVIVNDDLDTAAGELRDLVRKIEGRQRGAGS